MTWQRERLCCGEGSHMSFCDSVRFVPFFCSTNYIVANISMNDKLTISH